MVPMPIPAAPRRGATQHRGGVKAVLQIVFGASRLGWVAGTPNSGPEAGSFSLVVGLAVGILLGLLLFAALIAMLISFQPQPAKLTPGSAVRRQVHRDDEGDVSSATPGTFEDASSEASAVPQKSRSESVLRHRSGRRLVRDVGTQSQMTYKRWLSTPRFAASKDADTLTIEGARPAYS